jgi:hypothetical protein
MPTTVAKVNRPFSSLERVHSAHPLKALRYELAATAAMAHVARGIVRSRDDGGSALTGNAPDSDG